MGYFDWNEALKKSRKLENHTTEEIEETMSEASESDHEYEVGQSLISKEDSGDHPLLQPMPTELECNELQPWENEIIWGEDSPNEQAPSKTV